jgi:hypothetical protein
MLFFFGSFSIVGCSGLKYVSLVSAILCFGSGIDIALLDDLFNIVVGGWWE